MEVEVEVEGDVCLVADGNVKGRFIGVRPCNRCSPLSHEWVR